MRAFDMGAHVGLHKSAANPLVMGGKAVAGLGRLGWRGLSTVGGYLGNALGSWPVRAGFGTLAAAGAYGGGKRVYEGTDAALQGDVRPGLKTALGGAGSAALNASFIGLPGAGKFGITGRLLDPVRSQGMGMLADIRNTVLTVGSMAGDITIGGKSEALATTLERERAKQEVPEVVYWSPEVDNQAHEALEQVRLARRMHRVAGDLPVIAGANARRLV